MISLFLKMLEEIFNFASKLTLILHSKSCYDINNNKLSASGEEEQHVGDDGGPAGGVDDLHQDDGQDLLRPL